MAGRPQARGQEIDDLDRRADADRGDPSARPRPGQLPAERSRPQYRRPRTSGQLGRSGRFLWVGPHVEPVGAAGGTIARSEEHTSELQSLMRNLLCRLMPETTKNSNKKIPR